MVISLLLAFVGAGSLVSKCHKMPSLYSCGSLLQGAVPLIRHIGGSCSLEESVLAHHLMAGGSCITVGALDQRSSCCVARSFQMCRVLASAPGRTSMFIRIKMQDSTPIVGLAKYFCRPSRTSLSFARAIVACGFLRHDRGVEHEPGISLVPFTRGCSNSQHAEKTVVFLLFFP